MKYCPECKSDLFTQYHDGEERLICSSDGCSYVVWDNPVPVVAAVVELDGNYIIARNALWPEDIFSVIAGYLEKGESPEQAIIRECEEELGLSGVVVGYIGNYSFFEKNQLIIAYEIKATGTIEINHELAEVKILSKIELEEYDFAPLEITESVVADWSRLND